MFLTIESYLFDDPNNPNRNINQDPNQGNNQGGEDDNSNQPKCSKCNTSNATNQLTIQVTNTQETETHLLCDPCYQSFIKCQECQNQEITTATLKNNQKIYVCQECNQKLKDQAKQEIIAKEYKTKLNKILPFNNEERYFFTVDKAIKADKLTLEQLKELKTLLVQAWESDTDNNHSIWNKTVYVCPFIDHYLNILDPKIKELENSKSKNYLRKIQAVNPNCCNGKCQKNLADELVSESTMTCNGCKAEFTSGFTVHSNAYFCENCAKKNHADGEFKVWIEEMQREDQQNNPETPTPSEIPADQQTLTKPNQNSPMENKPTEPNQLEPKDLNRKIDNNPAEPKNSVNKSPHPDNAKKWGSDFGQLKPLQREGRMKTQNTWTNQKNISFICIHCQKLFPYDKSLENYLEARKKALNKLNTHKKSCSLKNSQEAKNKFQTFWDKARKTKQRIIKTCEKCWGKILWDKSIKDVEIARQQALSDLKYHQKHECGLEGKKKIAIYHSPNSGGNEHAPLDNSLTDDGVYLFDNEGEIYVEQVSQNKTNWGLIAGIGLVGLGIVGGLGFWWWNKRKAKKEG